MSSIATAHAAQPIIVWKANVLDRVERETGVVQLRWEGGIRDVPIPPGQPHVLYLAIAPGSTDSAALASRICRLIADLKDPGAGEVRLRFFEPAEYRSAEHPIGEVICP